MKNIKETTVIILVIGGVMLAGVGLSKLVDAIGLTGSSLWPIVFLVIGSGIGWFVYMNNTNGFALKSAKNTAMANDFWDHRKSITLKQLAARDKDEA